MESGKLISVIIPVYDVEKYLNRCLKSVIAQTYTRLQIILVDDGSRDQSGAMCDAWQGKDARIEVVHQKNGGLSDARNRGIDQARGEYLTFIDSDDEVSPGYIQYLYEMIVREGCDVSICACTVRKKSGEQNGGQGYADRVMNAPEAISRMLCDEGFSVSAWAKLYKKELFDGIRYPVGKICEDNGTTYQLLMRAKSIAYGHESHYDYCIRMDSIMTGTFSWRKFDLIELTDQMAERVLAAYPELWDVVVRRQLYARMSVLRQAVEDRSTDLRDPRLLEIRKYIFVNRKTFFKNKKMQRRDRLGYLSLIPGIRFYRICWNFYRGTGRYCPR